MIIKVFIILIYNGYLEMRIGKIRCKMMVPEGSFFSSESKFYCSVKISILFLRFSKSKCALLFGFYLKGFIRLVNRYFSGLWLKSLGVVWGFPIYVLAGFFMMTQNWAFMQSLILQAPVAGQ